MTKPQPRYEEIASYMRARVETAEPDERLPSDAELCAKFGVSRMTARQAVQVVVNEGCAVVVSVKNAEWGAPVRVRVGAGDRWLADTVVEPDEEVLRGRDAVDRQAHAFGNGEIQQGDAQAVAAVDDDAAVLLPVGLGEGHPEPLLALLALRRLGETAGVPFITRFCWKTAVLHHSTSPMLPDRDISAEHVTFDTEYSLVFLKIMRTPSRVYRQRLNDSGNWGQETAGPRCHRR